MREYTYLDPSVSSLSDLACVPDATTLDKFADCPRYYELTVIEGLEPKERSAQLDAGIAFHTALDCYYATGSEAEAVRTLRESWKQPAMLPKNIEHYSADFFELVLRRYFRYWSKQAVENLAPIRGLRIFDLDFSSVLGAKIRLTDNDEVILGESKFVMVFDVDGRELLLAGRPDLPVCTNEGLIYIMDHKTTSSSLSDFWARTHEVSSKDRGYMAMISKLLGCPIQGTVINAISLSKTAHLNAASKAVPFARYTFNFSPDHVYEALRNRLATIDLIEECKRIGYWPQFCGYGGCKAPSICRRDPDTRPAAKAADWKPSERDFWEL